MSLLFFPSYLRKNYCCCSGGDAMMNYAAGIFFGGWRRPSGAENLTGAVYFSQGGAASQRKSSRLGWCRRHCGRQPPQAKQGPPLPSARVVLSTSMNCEYIRRSSKLLVVAKSFLLARRVIVKSYSQVFIHITNIQNGKGRQSRESPQGRDRHP